MVRRIVDQHRRAVGVAEQQRHARLVGDQRVVARPDATPVGRADPAHVGRVALVRAHQVLAADAERRARPAQVLCHGGRVIPEAVAQVEAGIVPRADAPVPGGDAVDQLREASSAGKV